MFISRSASSQNYSFTQIKWFDGIHPQFFPLAIKFFLVRYLVPGIREVTTIVMKRILGPSPPPTFLLGSQMSLGEQPNSSLCSDIYFTKTPKTQAEWPLRVEASNQKPELTLCSKLNFSSVSLHTNSKSKGMTRLCSAPEDNLKPQAQDTLAHPGQHKPRFAFPRRFVGNSLGPALQHQGFSLNFVLQADL